MLDQLKAKTRFENEGEKNRLVLELEGDAPIIDFQVDMIRNNQISGLLPLEMRRVDSQVQLYYDVTGKWRLKDLLDNRELTGPEFILLLDRFIQTLTGAEAYLLEMTQFVLDEELIFLDGRMEPRLVYLPVKGTQNIHDRFKDLLLQLAVYRARLRDQDSGPVLSGILNFIKREDFNLYAFQKFIRIIDNGGTGSSNPVTHTSTPVPLPSPPGPVSLGSLIPQGDGVSPPPVIANPPKSISRKKEPAKNIPQPKQKVQPQEVRDYTTKMKYKSSAVFAVLLFQGVLAAGVYFGFDAVHAATEDITTTYGAMALMVLSLDGLVLKNLLRAENRIAVQIPVKGKTKKSPNPVSPIEAQVQPMTPQPLAVNFDKQVITNASAPKAVTYDTELLSPAGVTDPGSSDTVVLSSQAAAPYLVRKGPVQEIIRFRQTALVVGRQGDMADHVISDPAIGRMHAELSWVNNLCQIRDMNSKNGTFVNGQRLTGPKPVNIFVGDEVRLGSLEYTLAQD